MRAIILLFLLSSGVLADELVPARPIGGTLLIHGDETAAPSTIAHFLKLCDPPKAKLVVIGETSEPWSKHGFAKVDVLHTEADSEPSVKALQEADAVWINDSTQTYIGTRVATELHALLKRGGTIGGGAIIGEVTTYRGEKSTVKTRRGFGLLKGAVIGTRTKMLDIRAALAQQPSLVGYTMPKGQAIVMRGRRISPAARSTISFSLAKSETRRAELKLRRSDDPIDHIALSRAAIARAENLRFVQKPITVKSGTVIAIGGGGVPRGALEHFVESAGGKNARIVVIYTASSDDPKLSKDWKRLWDSVGATNVKALHASDLEEANSDAFVKEINAAGGVWFGGGRQWRLVDRYSGTASEAAIRKVLERGGVVGGSSAGATILGEYLVRGDPLTSRTMMQEGYEQGLALIPGAAIDQHFSQRNRFADMEALKKRYPQLCGFGIDETTAISFEGNSCQVFGSGKVFVYPVAGKAIELKAGDKMKFDQ